MSALNPDEGVVSKASSPGTKQIGVSGLEHHAGIIQEELLHTLVGQRGQRVFREMRDNDPIVGAFMFAIDHLVRQVEWSVEEASEDQSDVDAAEFLEECMEDMSMTWSDVISEIMSMLVFGWSWLEIVYKVRDGDETTGKSKYGDGKVGWAKMPLRAQETLRKWIISEDGGIEALVQSAPPRYIDTEIPIEKSLLFRTTVHKNNPEGRSVLRNAYRPWYFKKRIEEIEAVGIERDLAGLPIMYVDVEVLKASMDSEDPEQRSLAMLREDLKKIVSNVKRDAQEGALLPLAYNAEGQRLFEFQLLNAGGGRQFDTTGIIERYDRRIAMSVLSDFILLGHENVGSFALSSDKTSLFAVALGSLLTMIEDVFNTYAVPRLFAMNPEFRLEELPKIKHGDIEKPDLAALAAWFGALASAGETLFPDERLSKWTRQIAGMPEPSEDRQQMMEGLAAQQEDEAGGEAPAPEQQQEQPSAPTQNDELELPEPEDSEV